MKSGLSLQNNLIVLCSFSRRPSIQKYDVKDGEDGEYKNCQTGGMKFFIMRKNRKRDFSTSDKCIMMKKSSRRATASSESPTTITEDFNET